MLNYRVVEKLYTNNCEYDEGQGSYRNTDTSSSESRVVSEVYGDGDQTLLLIFCEYARGGFHLGNNEDSDVEYEIQKQEKDGTWSFCSLLRSPEAADVPEGYKSIWDWYDEYLDTHDTE